MAGIVAAVRSRLLQDATITQLVGTRIYPSVLPQPPAFPSITIQVVGSNTVLSHQGYSGLLSDLVQIDAYSKTQVEADALARRIRNMIDGWRGTAAQVTSPGAFRRTAATYFDQDAEAFRIRQDFTIWQQEG